MNCLEFALEAVEKAYVFRSIEALSDAKKILSLNKEIGGSSSQGIALALVDTFSCGHEDKLKFVNSTELKNLAKDAYLRVYMSLLWLDASRISDRLYDIISRKEAIRKCIQLYYQVLTLHGNINFASADTRARYIQDRLAKGLQNLQYWEKAYLSSESTKSMSIGMVIGMHRSGTSCLANLLVNLGYTAPGELLPANDGNALGYIEPKQIVDNNNKLLNTLAPLKGWRTLNKLVTDDIQCRLALDNWLKELAEFIFSHAGSSPLVIKDPRFSILLDYIATWIQSGECNWHFYISIRHPFESARSLMLRKKVGFSEGVRLWINYNLQLEASTSCLSRIFILYPDIVTNPLEWSDLIRSFAMKHLHRAPPLLFTDNYLGQMVPNLIHCDAKADESIRELADLLNPSLANLAIELYEIFRASSLLRKPIPFSEIKEIRDRYDLLLLPE